MYGRLLVCGFLANLFTALTVHACNMIVQLIVECFSVAVAGISISVGYVSSNLTSSVLCKQSVFGYLLSVLM